MRLYEIPVLYEALRAPPAPALVLVRRAIQEHLRGRVTSVMDPACGPGTWLVPFAREGARVAGNDLSAAMIQRAREALPGAELTVGDMREVVFEGAPFDVAIEASGTVSYLRDPDELSAMVARLGRMVRPGGLVVLNLFFDTGWNALPGEHPTYASPPRPLPGGGEAWISYTIVDRDHGRRMERLRRTVRTRGAEGLPTVVEDEYALRLWSVPEINALAASLPGLELRGVYEMPEWDGVDGAPNLIAGGSASLPAHVQDEHLVVFRVREDAATIEHGPR